MPVRHKLYLPQARANADLLMDLLEQADARAATQYTYVEGAPDMQTLMSSVRQHLDTALRLSARVRDHVRKHSLPPPA